MFDDYIVVERISTNSSDVVFLTNDGSVVKVSIYGYSVSTFDDDRLISIAKEELRRKADSDIFCLTSVFSKKRAEPRQSELDFLTDFSSEQISTSSVERH